MSTPPETIGHYRILELLGRGANATVYRAEHAQVPALKVALKCFDSALACQPAFREEIAREALLLQQLNHPNILRCRDLILEEEQVALVLELLQGESLDEHRRGSSGPVPLPTLQRWLVDLLQGLAAAHSRGVVHGDLKEANLFLTQEGPLKLLDFGVASALGEEEEEEIQGTPRYMAPERFQGEPLRPPVDVYALGLLAWEWVVGRPACPAGSIREQMGWHLAVGVTHPRVLRPDCPEGLADWIADCCSRSPALRPRDAGEALRLLEQASVAAAPRGEEPVSRRQKPDTVRLSRSFLEETQESLLSEGWEPGSEPFTEPPPSTAPAPSDPLPLSDFMLPPPSSSPAVLHEASPAAGPPPATTSPAVSRADTAAPPSAPAPSVPARRRMNPLLIPTLGVGLGVAATIYYISQQQDDEPAAEVLMESSTELLVSRSLMSLSPSLWASTTHAPLLRGSWLGRVAAQDSYYFDVQLLTDGRLDTCWQDAAKSQGIGSALQLTFPRPIYLDSLRIANGCQDGSTVDFGDLYDKNARVKTVQLILDDVPGPLLQLADRRGYQEIVRGSQWTDQPVQKIRLQIVDSYPSVTWPEIAVSELEILGREGP